MTRAKKPRVTEKPAFDVNEFIEKEEIEVSEEMKKLLDSEDLGMSGHLSELNQLSKKAAKKNKRVQAAPVESDSEGEGDLDSEEEQELELYLQMMEKNGQNEEGSSSEDADDSSQGEDELVEKIYANETVALLSRMEDIKLSSLFVDNLAHTVYGATADTITDVNDDLSRELAFYSQALKTATEGRKLCLKNSIPFSRPTDYFAEMVKSDDHMLKVRQKLLDQENSILESEKAKKQRNLKKFGKKVQVEKLQERQKDKKDSLEKIKGMRRKGIEGDDFDIDVEPKQTNFKRESKESKYGFGGKKRNAKSNTKDSTDDISAFSVARMKASRGGRGGSSRGGRGGSSTRGGSSRGGSSSRGGGSSRGASSSRGGASRGGARGGNRGRGVSKKSTR